MSKTILKITWLQRIALVTAAVLLILPVASQQNLDAQAAVVVSNTRVTATTTTSASLAWDTNVATCAQINYGTTPGSLNRQDIETGCPKTTGHTYTISGLSSNTLYYFQIVGVGTGFATGVSPQMSFSTVSTSPLTISDINVVSIGPTSATITWTTNKAATGQIQYGLTTGYEQPPVQEGRGFVTGHSVPLSGLSPSTTYHFRISSTTDTTSTPPSETVTSASDRTFVTTSGSGTSLPTITFGPRVDAINTQAVVTFSTNVPTAALIEYERTPATTLNFQACDAAANCVAPAPQPVSLSLNHTVTLSGLTQPSAQYRYRITIVDAARNPFTTSEFTFNTSSSSTDHVFTTGGCNDGTAIGQCNAAGQYCRPGGGEPVYDCRKNIPCSSQCTTGSTCQANGDCTIDPSLSGSPTQCNQKVCYSHCDANSGARSNNACTADLDCVDGINSGKCVVGAFNNPAVAGCFASWPSCDANIILKVRPDRICDKWLTCKTSLPVTDSLGKTENQCFDLTVCNSISPNGQCNGVLEGGQCSNDPLRFCQSDADCNAGGRCLNDTNGGPISVTFRTPENVSQIKDLSGYSRAGLDWAGQPNSPRIEGHYPYSMSKQVGTRVTITNSDFEDVVYVGSCKNNRSKSCSADTECSGSGDACQFQADSTVPVQRVWEGLTPLGSVGTASVQAEVEGATNTRNVLMKVTPTNLAGSGARLIKESRFTSQTNQQYVLSVRLRSTQDDQPIRVTLTNESSATAILDDAEPDGVVKLSTAWKSFRLGPVAGLGGRTQLNFVTTVTGDPVEFFVDDLALLPALKVNDSTFITQSCRIYPGDDSPKCDFVDDNGVNQVGFKGFCLERDPLNAALCLSWWPVDILSGENIFANDTNVGYQGRRPLYACALSEARPYPLTASAFNIGGDDQARTTVSSGFAPLKVSDIAYFEITFGMAGGGWGNTCSTQTVQSSSINVSSGAYTVRVFANPHVADDGVPVIGEFRFVEKDFDDHVVCNASTGPYNNWASLWDDDGDDYHDGGDHHQALGFRFEATGTGPNDTLARYKLKMVDDDDGGAGFINGMISVVERQHCTALVQVATPALDSAWVDRTAMSSTYVVPDLSRRYATDFAPFGLVANPNSQSPSTWPKLKVEGPFTALPGPQFQARAGTPVNCVDSPTTNCRGRYCDGYSGGLYGKSCMDSSQCDDGAGHTGNCVGGSVCLKYDPGTATYSIGSQTGGPKACRTTAECGAGLECVGGEFQPTFPIFDASETASYTSAYRAQTMLQRVFAQAYSVWIWDDGDEKWEDRTGSDITKVPWLPPSRLCNVCSGTNSSTNGKACTVNSSCGAGSTCVAGDRHPRENANPTTDAGADFCAIKPQVLNVNIDSPEVTIGDGGLFVLKFNTKVDREQLPITRITIDWGDGSADTIDSGLRIAPKEGRENPHLYAHTYDCRSVRCEYFPKIQVEDNWGWCSDGSRAGAATCNDAPNDVTFPWTGGVKVIVE